MVDDRHMSLWSSNGLTVSWQVFASFLCSQQPPFLGPHTMDRNRKLGQGKDIRSSEGKLLNRSLPLLLCGVHGLTPGN